MIKLSSSKGFSKPDRDLLDESLRAANQSQVALLVVEGDEMILFFVSLED